MGKKGLYRLEKKVRDSILSGIVLTKLGLTKMGLR